MTLSSVYVNPAYLVHEASHSLITWSEVKNKGCMHSVLSEFPSISVWGLGAGKIGIGQGRDDWRLSKAKRPSIWE